MSSSLKPVLSIYLDLLDEGVVMLSGDIAPPGDLNRSPKFQRRLSISV
jgi:hypothetical protein